MSAWFSSYLTQGDFSDLTLNSSMTRMLSSASLSPWAEEFVATRPRAPTPNKQREGMGQDSKAGTIPAGARTARITIQLSPRAAPRRLSIPSR